MYPDQPAVLLNPMVRPLAGHLGKQEAQELARLMVRDLFKCWGGEAGSRQRGYPQDHELTRLVLLAGEPHVLAATAAVPFGS